MKKTIAFCFAASLGLLSQASAITLVPLIDDETEQTATITHTIHNSNDQASNTFLASEPIQLQFTIEVRQSDVGQPGRLFLVAQYGDRWYQNTATGGWQLWNGQMATLRALQNKTLEKTETITALNKHTLSDGEFLFYAGYLIQRDERLFYNSTPASLVVFDTDSPALHKVKTPSLLADFFARGSAGAGGFPVELASAVNADAALGGVAEPVSQTNLQENGVDEGDRIKTDGDHLYTMESCDADAQKQCITAYSIQSEPASHTQLGQLDVGFNTGQQGSLYLSQINHNQHLIHLTDSRSAPILQIWAHPYYWQNNRTEIQFINVSQTDNMRSTTRITLDTSLISSRLVNGVLYLVTRKNDYFGYPDPAVSLESVLDVVPEFVVDTAEQTRPADPQLPQPAPENRTIEDLLPVISFNDGSGEQALVQASDCYIPSQNSVKPVDNTVVTLTAIPLDNPKAHYSSCVAGAVDTFYMSTDALYLATSRYPYSIAGNEIVYQPDQPGTFEMSTEIHKFALGKGGLDYRGSGTVPGHLGWEINKQPFRMGENKGILKVATSKGDSWNGTSTTRVSVLKEVAGKPSLEEISFLDNLGKPGERLYAARFIGNRGYLVTFRITDPLYVLDFSPPTQPEIVGALEIEGYSDYLHPIGENYLLGIGKDAIADKDENRGAWYQGVKLSLFDVSDGQNLHEIDSQVIGKRGTESGALYDHHALAWLSSGDSATLALPVQLNEQVSTRTGQDSSQPNAFYDWTHTGLYTFNINTGANPGIQLQHRLITDKPGSDDCDHGLGFCYPRGQATFNDRAVIQGGSVHYIHNDSVYSSAITGLN